MVLKENGFIVPLRRSLGGEYEGEALFTPVGSSVRPFGMSHAKRDKNSDPVGVGGTCINKRGEAGNPLSRGEVFLTRPTRSHAECHHSSPSSRRSADAASGIA